jgi:hypothetical protein
MVIRFEIAIQGLSWLVWGEKKGESKKCFSYRPAFYMEKANGHAKLGGGGGGCRADIILMGSF